jgi:hypothetical protein
VPPIIDRDFYTILVARFGEFLRSLTRRLAPFALVLPLSMTGCGTPSNSNPVLNNAIQNWLICLNDTARRMDDRRSGIRKIAMRVMPACHRLFVTVATATPKNGEVPWELTRAGLVYLELKQTRETILSERDRRTR